MFILNRCMDAIGTYTMHTVKVSCAANKEEMKKVPSVLSRFQDHRNGTCKLKEFESPPLFLVKCRKSRPSSQ